MATQTRENPTACRLQHLTMVRSQVTIDSFPQALLFIENSHSSFVSAIGCFIGRLYLVSQSQKEFTSTLERLVACCDDLTLTIENAWLKLHMGVQTIKLLLANTRQAAQSLVSAADTLKFDNRLDGSNRSVMGVGREWTLLFDMAMDLFRAANSLMSGARVVLNRSSRRQRELETRQQVFTQNNKADKAPQERPQTREKCNYTFSLFPQCATSLGPRPKRVAPMEVVLEDSASGSAGSEIASHDQSPCIPSHEDERCDPLGMHPSKDDLCHRLIRGSHKMVCDAPRRSLPASPSSHVPREDNSPIDKNNAPDTAQRKHKNSRSFEGHQTSSDRAYIQTTKPPNTTYKHIAGGQRSLLTAQWQSRRPLSSISEVSEAQRQSWREGPLSPSLLGTSPDMMVSGGGLARLVKLQQSLWRRLSSCGNSCKRSISDAKKSVVDAKKRSAIARSRKTSEPMTPRDTSSKSGNMLAPS
ncbi:hypothetical protein ACHAPJ_007763 [Fusarium lateritium]